MTTKTKIENPYLDEFKQLGMDRDFGMGMNFREKYDHRERLRKEYGYAVPNVDAIEGIAQFGPVVEIGAGGGYWAWQLQQRGVDVVCYDNGSWPFHFDMWHEVKDGGPSKAWEHSDKTLMLVWPTYNDPCALNCLRFYKGKYVVYVGEGQGGCTGTHAFHKMLGKEYELVKGVSIPQYDGLHDYCEIWRRI